MGQKRVRSWAAREGCGEELKLGIEGYVGVPWSAKGPWVFCACWCVWVCVNTRRAQDARRSSQAKSGRHGGLLVSYPWTPGPLSQAHSGRAPGTAPCGCGVGGGSAFSSGRHMPCCRRLSTVLSGISAAEISPNSLFPAGSSQATPGLWGQRMERDSSPPSSSWHGTGRGALGSNHVAGRGGIVGVCRWLRPSVEPRPSCGGLCPLP